MQKLGISPANIGLMIAGTSLLATGLFRSFPLSFNRGFWIQNGLLIGIIAIIIVWLAIKWGPDELLRGMRYTIQTTSQYTPMLSLFFIAMGFGFVLSTHYNDWLKELVAGKWGLPGTLFGAFIIPSSNAVAKTIEMLWQEPTARGTVLYFLSVTPLASLNIFMIRQMGFGHEIAAAMYKTNLVIAVALIPFFWIGNKLLSR